MQLDRQSARPHEYLLIVVAFLGTVALTVSWYGAVPNPVATHWGFSGEPDGFMPKIVDAALILILVASSLVFVWAAGRADRPAAQLMVATANALAVFFAGLRYLTYSANVDASTWADASAITGFDLIGPLVGGIIAGGFGYVAARERPAHVVQVRHVTAAAKDHAADTFEGYVAARVMTAVPVIVTAIGVIAFATVSGPLARMVVGVCAAVVVVSGLFTRAHVRIDTAHVQVGFGPLGWPRVTRRLADITDVVVLDVEPLSFGGWGYRVLPGVRAVVIRRGEGIRLASRDKPDLVITLDRAEVAASVIARHVETA